MPSSGNLPVTDIQKDLHYTENNMDVLSWFYCDRRWLCVSPSFTKGNYHEDRRKFPVDGCIP